MQLGDQDKNGSQDGNWVAARPAVMAAGAVLIGCFVAFSLMNLEDLRPKVGDIVPHPMILTSV